MTLPEAIVIIKSLLDGTYDHRTPDMEQAFVMSIEALQEKQHRQEGGTK